MAKQTAVAMSKAVARSRADDIKGRLDSIAEHIAIMGQLLVEAYQDEDWKALGYESWANYCHEEFGTHLLKIDVSVRQVIGAQLKAIDASYAEIGSATGRSKGQAWKDLNPSDSVDIVSNETIPTTSVGNQTTLTSEGEQGRYASPTNPAITAGINKSGPAITEAKPSTAPVALLELPAQAPDDANRAFGPRVTLPKSATAPDLGHVPTDAEITEMTQAWKAAQGPATPIEGFTDEERDQAYASIMYKMMLARFEDSDNRDALREAMHAEVERAFNESR